MLHRIRIALAKRKVQRDIDSLNAKADMYRRYMHEAYREGRDSAYWEGEMWAVYGAIGVLSSTKHTVRVLGADVTVGAPYDWFEFPQLLAD